MRHQLTTWYFDNRSDPRAIQMVQILGTRAENRCKPRGCPGGCSRLELIDALDDQILEKITEEVACVTEQTHEIRVHTRISWVYVTQATEEADIEKEIDERGKFSEDIHEVMIKINSLLISRARSC